MSEEQQQSSKEYSYDVATLPDTVPPVPQNLATMPRDRAIQIHLAPEIPQDDISMPPPTAYPAYYEPHRVGYAQYFGPIPPNDGVTHMHNHTPFTPQPIVAPAQPCGPATATANGPPYFDVPFGGMAQDTPAPSGRRPKRSRQDFDDAGNNPAVPGTSMTNIYRDLAMRFINNPQANIIVIRMASSEGRSRVMIELEIDGAA